MAWNPSPEVAVARDAAKGMEAVRHSKVTQIVVVYLCDNGKFGASSYGPTKAECAKAGKLCDVLFDRTTEYLEAEGQGT